jgi:hypothetical protein
MTTMDAVCVLSPDAEPVFRLGVARYATVHRASSLPELRDVLESLRGQPYGGARSLDLLGHSTSGHHLLRLGNTPIDMLNPTVSRFFQGLAASELLPALGIDAVRLLGCETAVTDAGHRTIRMLARTLGLAVYGTLVPLVGRHWRADVFDPAFAHLLVEASALTV